MTNPDKPALQAHFARTLRALRVVRRLSQEAFDATSGRTYLSAMERGLKIPTLGKIEHLARVLNVHPATLVALSYCAQLGKSEFRVLMDTVAKEGLELLTMYEQPDRRDGA